VEFPFLFWQCLSDWQSNTPAKFLPKCICNDSEGTDDGNLSA